MKIKQINPFAQTIKYKFDAAQTLIFIITDSKILNGFHSGIISWFSGRVLRKSRQHLIKMMTADIYIAYHLYGQGTLQL
jgi:hypothetical protein